ncbi:YlbE family protein [Orrella dioscoreae]|uniref:DUF1116 domain-containing protein n=1 Tax=Orrella dioscoreae TaxID=1851544 RepID=A0A1C3K6U2_9BURK|nr:DUF1116 domain-containing protein [Orrella dioscoreae]SBT27192.1 FIG074102: hypothetical protein [Orrella dioscoreae]SOE46072.1 FIG074102: hypothetical protein [Orrella dioscoreae]
MRTLPPEAESRLPGNAGALARLCAVRPVWRAVRTAREALGLPEGVLLHAGPPYEDPARPAAPVLSSAVLACLHEGWASSEEEAESLITTGRVRLVPAQQHGTVLPLAAVAGPGTALVEVADADGNGVAWSLLGSGAGPQIRFGSRDPAILARLRWRDTVLAPRLHALVSRQPVGLLALAHAGIQGGDDLHASTSAAQQALLARLGPGLGEQQGDVDILAMLGGTPLFFLTLWMAATHLMLDTAAAQGRDPDSTLVVAMAGNGREVGIRLAGEPARWFTQPAPPPAGPRLDLSVTAPAGPMVGDSGVIDAAGFGAQALSCAPQLRDALQAFLPGDWRERPARLSSTRHPAFADLDLRLGADARAGVAPLAAIAMVAADGRAGLLGRGIVSLDAALFAQAAQALAQAGKGRA